MQDFYIFDTKLKAENALNYINNSNWFPADGGLTVKWADEVTELIDGRFAIPRIPSARLDLIGVENSQRLDFFNANPCQIEQISNEKIKVKINE